MQILGGFIDDYFTYVYLQRPKLIYFVVSIF